MAIIRCTNLRIIRKIEWKWNPGGQNPSLNPPRRKGTEGPEPEEAQFTWVAVTATEIFAAFSFLGFLFHMASLLVSCENGFSPRGKHSHLQTTLRFVSSFPPSSYL